MKNIRILFTAAMVVLPCLGKTDAPCKPLDLSVCSLEVILDGNELVDYDCSEPQECQEDCIVHIVSKINGDKRTICICPGESTPTACHGRLDFYFSENRYVFSCSGQCEDEEEFCRVVSLPLPGSSTKYYCDCAE